MYDPECSLVSEGDIEEARRLVEASPLCRRTPLLHNLHRVLDEPGDHLTGTEIHLKLENMQTTGSYKMRGMINQLSDIPAGYGSEDKRLISYSAGNYGKAFAYLTSKLGLHAMVLMPETAPANRSTVIESYGVPTERKPSSELQNTVDKYVAERGMLFCHSFDDVRLIAGHASVGCEILEDLPDADVVVVPCGGGALLSGVASAVRLTSTRPCRVYGVEPEGACTMHRSLREGRPVAMAVKTVASGLAPPIAGANSYRHCRERVDDVVVVSDDQILAAMYQLYDKGLVVEPSGAAGFAALVNGKIPDVKGRKVVVVITGGNVTAEEYIQYGKRG